MNQIQKKTYAFYFAIATLAASSTHISASELSFFAKYKKYIVVATAIVVAATVGTGAYIYKTKNIVQPIAPQIDEQPDLAATPVVVESRLDQERKGYAEVLTSFCPGIDSEKTEKVRAFFKPAVDFCKEKKDALKKTCVEKWPVVKETCKEGYTKTTNYAQEKWPSVKETCTNAWEKVKNSAKNLYQTVFAESLYEKEAYDNMVKKLKAEQEAKNNVVSTDNVTTTPEVKA